MYYAQDSYPNVKLGTSTDSIAQDGCALVAISNIAGIDPVTLNERFVAAGDYASGEMIEWGNCAVTAGLRYLGADSTPTVYPCIGCTDHYKSLGFPTHFFEILDAGNIVDSIDGKVKPISTYNIIQVQNVTTNVPTMDPLSEIRTAKVSEFQRDGESLVYQIFSYSMPDAENFFLNVMGDSFDNVRKVPTDWPIDPASWGAQRSFLQPQIDAANAQITELQGQIAALTAETSTATITTVEPVPPVSTTGIIDTPAVPPLFPEIPPVEVPTVSIWQGIANLISKLWSK